jgi:hypothetical protein
MASMRDKLASLVGCSFFFSNNGIDLDPNADEHTTGMVVYYKMARVEEDYFEAEAYRSPNARVPENDCACSISSIERICNR